MYVGLSKAVEVFTVFFKNVCYQKLKSVMCSLIHLKYMFSQNEYNLPYGRMFLFLRKLSYIKHIQNFRSFIEP